ncbi:MAG: DUF115 domain-containing protein [Treponemataceae bacterium]|nr:DUF115 domain-containing protein [Treponemataceae bacterium]
MAIVFSDAKNGERTCSLGGKYVHSAYNPSKEAEQFVAGLAAPFNPSAVIIIEPALSYCAPFLRTRFPQTALYVIRTSAAFSADDGAWDAVFATDDTLGNQLFERLGEETICSTLFLAWPPSERLFPDETKRAWQAIKTAVLKSRDVLATRSFFAKRWIKNAVRFCARIQHPALLHKGTADILIAASGPSLRTSLPHIAACRARFFIIALSSALLPLLHEGITPDLVLSTDGGFWAKKHLAFHDGDFPRIPFALAAEGAAPAALLETQTVVPLWYDDSIAAPLLRACDIPAMRAARNGTVSGTAVELALALTSGNVYLCGLDLATARGFQHTQPNALEQHHAAHDDRLRTKHTRLAASATAAQGSLAVYRDWFVSVSQRWENRVFRLSDSYNFVHNLGKIRDVNWEIFSASNTEKNQRFPSVEPIKLTSTDRKNMLAELLPELFATNRYDRDLYPIETLMQQRAATEAERIAYGRTVSQGKAQFVRELLNLL